jgi:predicted alpha/beta-hydrolase family hydrolase
MPHDILATGPVDADVTILLAHGAGGAMDTPWMEAIARSFANNGIRLLRFEFGYMAARRSSGKRAPPPRVEILQQEYRAAIDDVPASHALVIGGKSMGGRVASMIADDLYDSGKIRGLLCLGYPFHPIGKPDSLRTAHLADLRTPTLVCQGTRDQFGSREEVDGYHLSNHIEMLWLEDGDHDLKPRKAISGFTQAEHIETVAKRVAAWSRRL